jgi:hypothetical protein
MEFTRLNPSAIALDNTYKGVLLTINTSSGHIIFIDDTRVFIYIEVLVFK